MSAGIGQAGGTRSKFLPQPGEVVARHQKLTTCSSHPKRPPYAGTPLQGEPGHPQDLIALLLACLLVAATLKGRSFMRPVLLGTLLAAITMTKINEGIYLPLALFLATLFSVPGLWAH